jgi:4-aminobutyrate aminotransferase-like enzyme
VAPRGDRESHRTLQGTDYVYPDYAYAPWTELARLLASLAPRPLTTCFRATGGSEAVDLALQAAMIHTWRRAFLSLEGSYHGNTLAGLSIGATDNREQIKNLLPHCGKVAPPLDPTALRRIASVDTQNRPLIDTAKPAIN